MARHRRYCGPPDPICSQRPASRSTSAQDLHQGICEPRQRLSFPSGTLPGRSCSLWRRVRLRRFWASPASPAVRIAWKGPGSGGIDPTDDGDTRVAARARHKAGLSLAPRNPPSRSETRWSERQDLNLRPPVPQTDALPGCATLRLGGAGRLRPAAPRRYGMRNTRYRNAPDYSGAEWLGQSRIGSFAGVGDSITQKVSHCEKFPAQGSQPHDLVIGEADICGLSGALAQGCLCDPCGR